MSSSHETIAGVGLADRPRKSRWPARMDFAQSATGLVLALFMWGHMFFVSSILLGKDAMWAITKMFEGYFFTNCRAFPGLVSVIVGAIFLMVVVHAFLAMRKFPANYRQYREFIGHKNLMRHDDTTLWWFQAVTGFLLFFIAAVHLYQMLMHPGDIGPYESADRVWSERWWPLYLVALFAVELHGGIGLYRLCVKWGWLEGKDANASRKRLKTVKWVLTVFFIVLGLATLGAYMKIGMEHQGSKGERYPVPSWAQCVPKGA